MKQHVLAVIFFFFASFVHTSAAAVTTQADFYEQKGYVNDFSKTLSSAKSTSLEKELASLGKNEGIHFVVILVTSLEGQTIQDASQRFFSEWQIGHRKRDSGILLLLAVEEKTSYIDLGYGLDDLITSSQALRINEEVINPLLQQGKISEAVEAGVHALFSQIGVAFGKDGVSSTRSVYTTWQASIFLLSIPLLFLVTRFAPTRFFFLSPLLGFCTGILQSIGLGIVLGALGVLMVLISYILKKTFKNE